MSLITPLCFVLILVVSSVCLSRSRLMLSSGMYETSRIDLGLRRAPPRYIYLLASVPRLPAQHPTTRRTCSVCIGVSGLLRFRRSQSGNSGTSRSVSLISMVPRVHGHAACRCLQCGQRTSFVTCSTPFSTDQSAGHAEMSWIELAWVGRACTMCNV